MRIIIIFPKKGGSDFFVINKKFNKQVFIKKIKLLGNFFNF